MDDVSTVFLHFQNALLISKVPAGGRGSRLEFYLDTVQQYITFTSSPAADELRGRNHNRTYTTRKDAHYMSP